MRSKRIKLIGVTLFARLYVHLIPKIWLLSKVTSMYYIHVLPLVEIDKNKHRK